MGFVISTDKLENEAVVEAYDRPCPDIIFLDKFNAETFIYWIPDGIRRYRKSFFTHSSFAKKGIQMLYVRMHEQFEAVNRGNFSLSDPISDTFLVTSNDLSFQMHEEYIALRGLHWISMRQKEKLRKIEQQKLLKANDIVAFLEGIDFLN